MQKYFPYKVCELKLDLQAERLTDDGGLQVDEDGPRDVLASARLGEKGVEGVVATSDGLVRRHLTVGLKVERI